jgi:hypothetical protein
MAKGHAFSCAALQFLQLAACAEYVIRSQILLNISSRCSAGMRKLLLLLLALLLG